MGRLHLNEIYTRSKGEWSECFYRESVLSEEVEVGEVVATVANQLRFITIIVRFELLPPFSPCAVCFPPATIPSGFSLVAGWVDGWKGGIY